MRVSELIGCRVVDDAGATVGEVTDVRLAQVGRPRGVLAEFLVETLLVSPRRAGSLFGYERRGDQGPWLIRLVVRWLHRGAFLVDWSDVDHWDAGQRTLVLRSGHARRDTSPVA